MTSPSKWLRSWGALRALAAGALVALALPASAQTHVDNPFLGATQYVNPDFTRRAELSAGVAADPQVASRMRFAGRSPTAVWLDRVEAVPSLVTHLDRALATGSDLALFVLHDLPGRGCDELVLDGELPLTPDGLAAYESQFIDPIAAIAASPKYAGLRIVFIVEPDSLAHLVTSLSSVPCAQAQASGIYIAAVQYAVNRLHALPNVYLYLDIEDASWLGWDSNALGMVALLDSVSAGFTAGKNALDGFSTNVGGFVPLREPFFTTATRVGGQPVSSAKFYEYNSDLDDASFAAAMWARFTAAGWPTTIGMLADTSRNGWGGGRRPTGPSPAVSDLERFVNESRVDRRTTRSAWCNPAGAGLGEQPQAAPAGYAASHYDAFAWVKTPGLSDGSAEEDRWCDPSYLTPGGVRTGALDAAPPAGEWFDAQFTELVQNQWPVATSDPELYPLTVQQVIGGMGSGTVTSSPAGIRCPSTCTASFAAGTVVTLTATTIPGNWFQGWGRACSGTASTCVVTVKEATNVDAVFAGPGIGYTVTVSRAGDGSGTVVSSPANIDCGRACLAMFPMDSVVTLTATAAAGSSFAGWSGACAGTSPTCTLRMSANQTVGTRFYALDTRLTVALAGTGQGTVTSPEAGISCGTSCSASLASASLVTLTATAASGSSFAGWSGACAGAQTTCLVRMTSTQQATARFEPGTWYPLTVVVSESGICNRPPGCLPEAACIAVCHGGNAVTSTPAGISCGNGGTCSAAYPSATSVVLTATPYDALNLFAGWVGACGGSTSRTCVVPMNEARSVTARFLGASNHTLHVSTSGDGAGKVTGWSGAVDCGTVCDVPFTAGTTVTLTATAAAGSTFTGWTGEGCSGATATCVVTMTGDLTISAAFTAAESVPLTVHKAGLGTGAVASSPAGIVCGATCTASFPVGSRVTLTAASASGSVFAGWGGPCTGASSTCVVTLTQAEQVTASFGGPNPIFAVTKAGTGAGTVVSSPAGIDCGSVCSASLPTMSATVTATAAAGSRFAGWSGGCTGTAATCVLTADALTQRASAEAIFTLAAGPCPNAITFSWNTANFGTTGAACYRTSQRVNGWGCSSFAGRTVQVNDGAATAACGAGPFPLQKASDGYTYFAVSAGQYPWASLYVW